ncbi:MAG: hypothetical protein NTU83_14075 [Candidatus Hydrogenedentes bacterium]|nr:hypothetical protein [Candidatus Hydrogenedentota bacterium]
MDLRQSLVLMIKQMLQDMEVILHQGSGYYTCTPFARRYNKLLQQARRLYTEDNALLGTFEELPDADPKDPSDKMKVLLGIRIECGQLIAFLESTSEGPAS